MSARSRLRLLALGAMFTIGAACAESEPVDLAILAGTGGASAAGGSTGSGGATSTGGTTGSGGSAGKSGSPGSGGTAGKGGAGGRGGAAGHGGAAGLGGAGAKGGQSGTGGGAGGATATFTQVYKTILSMRCSGASCHNPGSQQGFSVSSQANAYNTAQQFIIPGDSYGSTLWEAVDFGDMPRNAARLSDANIALIGAWIDEGAPNN